MVAGSSKISNQDMHYGNKTFVGVINDVPDKINLPSFYSKSEVNRMFDEAQHDVYVRTANAPMPKKEGVPAILKILGGAIGVTSLVLWHKSIGKGLMSFIKNLPK